MKALLQRQVRDRQRRIARRLAPSRHAGTQACPMFRGGNIRYELSARNRGIACGGIGTLYLLAKNSGLVSAIDRNLHLLKVHLPYHESDHVLNMALNILAGGQCLQDLELLRNDEAFLDALGAPRIPDPTTAGDFCRRFDAESIGILQDTINEVRLKVWSQQEPEFFRQAILEADGTIAPTTGECKEGMDISYDGQWGYHPLVVSLANTREPLFLVNRRGSRPSHEGAHQCFDQAIDMCRKAGFKSILLRGDADFSQTRYLDGWNAQDEVRFIFGMDSMKNLNAKADALPDSAWIRLERPAAYQVQTGPRERPENIKEQIVKERAFRNIRLNSEDVAEFSYAPVACKEMYRMVVVRKNLSVEKGEQVLFDDMRYFFYITNDWNQTAREIVLSANDRCDQENLIQQLKHGVHATRMPVDTLESNWAYMVIASLAWTLKAWMGLCLPVRTGRWEKRHREQKRQVIRMEFRSFLNSFIRQPCQILKTGRRLVYRLLGWNPWLEVFLRAFETVRHPMLQ